LVGVVVLILSSLDALLSFAVFSSIVMMLGVAIPSRRYDSLQNQSGISSSSAE